MSDWYYKNGYREFSDIVGKTFKSVTGLVEGSDEIVFTFTDGSEYKMYHEQDCCESVLVSDVCGDIEDLIDATVLEAREDVNDGPTDDWGTSTWTFYNIQTNKGCVQIRWLGESNGYYSESVDFKLINQVN